MGDLIFLSTMPKCFVNFGINRGDQGRQSLLIMNYSLILEKVQQHVHTFFEFHRHPLLVFHNEKHTQGVVAGAQIPDAENGL